MNELDFEKNSSPPNTGEKRMHSRLAIFIAIMCGFIVIGTGCFFIGRRSGVAAVSALNVPLTPVAPQDHQSNDDVTMTIPTEQIQGLKVSEVTDHEFRPEKQTTGKIANDDELTTPVFSLVGGHAIKLHVKPGDIVATNATLVDIDSPDMFQAEVALISSFPATNKARLTLEQMQRIAARQQRLYDIHAIALKDLEQAQADVRTIENDLRTAQVTQEAARGQLRIFGKTEEEISALEKGLLPSRLAVIRSPIAGTVVSRKIGIGQLIRPDNADPMFTIADLSKVWMVADLYETDARWISMGQPIEVTVMAFPDEVFPGNISYISPSVDPNTHRISIRCTIDNTKDFKLKPEMFATFRVFSTSKISVPAVPVAAITHVGNLTYIWINHDQNQFTKKQVVCGLQQNGFVQIISGLHAGDRIATQGGLFLDRQ